MSQCTCYISYHKRFYCIELPLSTLYTRNPFIISIDIKSIKLRCNKDSPYTPANFLIKVIKEKPRKKKEKEKFSHRDISFQLFNAPAIPFGSIYV